MLINYHDNGDDDHDLCVNITIGHCRRQFIECFVLSSVYWRDSCLVLAECQDNIKLEQR